MRHYFTKIIASLLIFAAMASANAPTVYRNHAEIQVARIIIEQLKKEYKAASSDKQRLYILRQIREQRAIIDLSEQDG